MLIENSMLCDPRRDEIKEIIIISEDLNADFPLQLIEFAKNLLNVSQQFSSR